jgi:hypothetical protein
VRPRNSLASKGPFCRRPVPGVCGVSWQWLNLAAPEFEAPSDPPYIAGLIYPGLRHVLSGPPESAKTLVGLILALTVQRQNELVAHIDFEMGPKRTRTLLEDLGATADEIADHIYTETGGPPDEADLAHLTVNGVALALIDAGAGAYNAYTSTTTPARTSRRSAQPGSTPSTGPASEPSSSTTSSRTPTTAASGRSAANARRDKQTSTSASS